jgi:hypothetical protein
MKKIITSEFRQLLSAQLVSLGTGAALFAVILGAGRLLPTDARPAGVKVNYVMSMLICAAPILLAWVESWRGERESRLRLLQTLPLSQRRLNMARLLASLIALWPAMLVWIPLWALLASIYEDVSGWLAVWVCLLLVDLLLLAMRWRGAVVAVYLLTALAIVPLYFLPLFELLVIVPAIWLVPPWASLALALQTAALGWWVIGPPPSPRCAG